MECTTTYGAKHAPETVRTPVVSISRTHYPTCLVLFSLNHVIRSAHLERSMSRKAFILVVAAVQNDGCEGEISKHFQCMSHFKPFYTSTLQMRQEGSIKNEAFNVQPVNPIIQNHRLCRAFLSLGTLAD